MLCNELHICSLQRAFYLFFFCSSESKGNRIKDKVRVLSSIMLLLHYSPVLCVSDVKDALNPV